MAHRQKWQVAVDVVFGGVGGYAEGAKNGGVPGGIIGAIKGICRIGFRMKEPCFQPQK